MTPEQPNTPELMAEYLIEKHRPYAEKHVKASVSEGGGNYFRQQEETKNATQSAIVSAEVARDSLKRVRTPNIDYEEVVLESEIDFCEQTIKYLNDKL